MKFYNLDGKVISPQELVNKFSDAYYIGNVKISGIRYTQTSKYVEDEIEKILYGHFNSYKDVVRVMAWKVGKIKHKESVDRFEYAEDWRKCEEQNPLLYKKEFDIQKLARYILKNRERLERLALEDPQLCLNKLRDLKIAGIGTVYLITLLYFLSHGEYPIYDRFVDTGLEAYVGDIKQGGKLKNKIERIPSKNDKAFSSICKNEYANYIARLDLLKIDYKKSRKLDRALWIYGHAYPGKKGC